VNTDKSPLILPRSPRALDNADRWRLPTKCRVLSVECRELSIETAVCIERSALTLGGCTGKWVKPGMSPPSARPWGRPAIRPVPLRSGKACSAVQCSAVQCSAVQCSAVQCSAWRLMGVLGQTDSFHRPDDPGREGWPQDPGTGPGRAPGLVPPV
jgi:hypothetical protein